MAEKFVHSEVYDFSAGVNQSVSRLIKAENESEAIENGELASIGGVSKTAGYSQKGSDVKDGYAILGIVNGYKPSDGTRKHIVVANGAANSDAYTYNPITDTWTPHSLSLTAGAKAEFESFLDGFFMVNYSDATRWNDLTQWYTTTNVTNAPKAYYIKQYLSRIYLFYVSYDGSVYPSRCVYSDLPSGSPMTIAWDNTNNYFDVATDDGDVAKGMEVNSNRLLLFKENSLYRYDTNTLYKVPGCPGTVSQRSVKNIEGWTLYFHSTGLWGYNGTESKLLSRRVVDIINGVSTNNWTSTCAWVEGDHYYVYLGDVKNTSVGLQISKCLLDYDIAKNAFTWRSLLHEPTVFCDFRDSRTGYTYDNATITYNSTGATYSGLLESSEATKAYFGDSSGAVFRFNSGKSYAGTAIPFKHETKDYYFNFPSLYKLFQKVYIFVDSRKGITIQYKLDDGDWATLGRVSSAQSELVFPTSARGKRIRFRVLESSSGDKFTFEGFDVYYTLEGLVD